MVLSEDMAGIQFSVRGKCGNPAFLFMGMLRRCQTLEDTNDIRGFLKVSSVQLITKAGVLPKGLCPPYPYINGSPTSDLLLSCLGLSAFHPIVIHLSVDYLNHMCSKISNP